MRLSALSCKPGLKIMCAAQLPRQVPPLHHSGGISKPLQVENYTVKLWKIQTACEPRVLRNSKGLSWVKAWQVFSCGPFLSVTMTTLFRRYGIIPLPRGPSENNFTISLTVKNFSADKFECLMGSGAADLTKTRGSVLQCKYESSFFIHAIKSLVLLTLINIENKR